MRILPTACCFLVLLLTGCGSPPVLDVTPPPPDVVAAPPAGDTLETPLADLLTRPRSELAALTDEWLTRLAAQDQARRDGRLLFTLLPDAPLPLTMPVFREAVFANGLTLPPYVAAGTTDAEVAGHLARYGDAEAARKVGGDAARFETPYDRNYPVEWTRLVGVLQHAAGLRLASGDEGGALEVVALHRQLREVLDAKAQRGPLGAALLGRGRHTLTLAATAWKAAGKAGPAADALKALADWGETPAPTPALAPGAARADLSRLLRTPWQGHAIVAAKPQRALDLLDLPAPDEGVQAVVALFGADERLAELLVTYRPSAATFYREPRHLGATFEDAGLTGTDARTPGLTRRSYTAAGLTVDATLVARSEAVGLLLSIRGGPAVSVGPLGRDLGAASLDRGFEQNRLRLAPEQAGPTVQIDRAAALTQLRTLLDGAPAAQAVLQRDGSTDVTARLLVRALGDGVRRPLHELAAPLWADGGPSVVTSAEDEGGGHLALVWHDGQTRRTLRLPFTGQALELDLEDVSDGEVKARRADLAREVDRRERSERLKSNKPLTRLPRFLDHEGVRLGHTRQQVLAGLPQGSAGLRQNLADGLSVVVSGDAPKHVPYVARHLFVRFDAAGRAVELRTRYGEGGAGPGWATTLVNGLKKQAGAPTELAVPATWADLPASKTTAALSRWRDDLTQLTCLRDGGGVEVTLRDASGLDEPARPPLEYLTRGPGDVTLGDTADEVKRVAGGAPQVLSDGAWLVTPRNAIAFDALLVYQENDRVVRVVARHVTTPPANAKPAQLAKAVTDAWAKELRALGWPRRQDVQEQVVQGLGWNDDRTRVRLFWQPSAEGSARVYTEWKDVAP